MDRRSEIRGSLVVGVVILMATMSLGLGSVNVSAGAITPVWTSEAPMGETRAQAMVVESGGLIYVMGGVRVIGTNPVANVSSYNPGTGAWTDLEPMPYAVRAAAATEGIDGKIYVFSGEMAGPQTQATQIYDPATDSWSAGANIPTAVWQGKAATDSDGLMYVLGGYSNGFGANIASVQIYDPITDSWSAGTNMPSARSGGAAVALNDYIYYLGGSTTDWGAASNVVMLYDPYWDSWSTGPAMPVAVADFGAAVGLDGFLYTFGGGTDGANVGEGRSTGYYLNPNNDTWSALAPMTMLTKNLGAAATDDGRVWALGGNNNSDNISSVESLEIARIALSVPSSVAQGHSLMVTVGGKFAYSTVQSIQVTAYLESADGTASMRTAVGLATTESVMFVMSIPETMPPGSYTLVVDALYFITDVGYVMVPDRTIPLTIAGAPTQDQLIEDLQNQISALQNQTSKMDANSTGQSQDITGLQNQIDDLQSALDKAKASASSASMYGMIVLVLAIVVIGLLGLMLLMGRKKL